MVKVIDALWIKYRHIKLQMIQCDCQKTLKGFVDYVSK